jgi:hypothetical protein
MVKTNTLTGILHWCDSVEETFSPREIVPKHETPNLVPEQFLACAIRYLRVLCVEDSADESNVEEFQIKVSDQQGK